MKGIRIDSKTREITEVEISKENALPDMYKAIGCDCFCIGGEIGEQGDTLFVDDEGLLKSPTHGFQLIGGHQALAGNGLIVGCDEEGESRDAICTVEEVKRLVTFCEFEREDD